MQLMQRMMAKEGLTQQQMDNMDTKQVSALMAIDMMFQRYGLVQV